MLKSRERKCINCGGDLAPWGYKYCSNNCQMDHQYKSYVEKWKVGEESGLQGIGIVSRHLKRYLRSKFSNKCCLCGWCKINPRTGETPLVADHIDGNWRNNEESNIRLICPNCDALSPTYAGLNIGKGRGNRVVSKRVKEGRLLANRRSNSVVE